MASSAKPQGRCSIDDEPERVRKKYKRRGPILGEKKIAPNLVRTGGLKKDFCSSTYEAAGFSLALFQLSYESRLVRASGQANIVHFHLSIDVITRRT